VDVAKPWTAVTSPLLGSILMVLIGTTEPLTGREVHRLSGVGSQEGVRKALQRLTSHGLVRSIEKRGTSLFTLNRSHLAAPAVEILTSMRGELIQRVRQAVAGWTIQPLHLSLFGSTARGDGGSNSDIDLLLVRPDNVDSLDPEWDSQVGNLREAIHGWTGNYVSYMEQSREELRALFASGSPLLREWQRDAILFCGISLLDLLQDVS
jgi:hypothetical protein